eukprot:CAMPEP_0183300774 /NCGR_PEP_ID=MMETSP0160_2-20130417/7083_1 /TAXON_ID=2839 ORGANISM="Odontella Sinensis, Strain Grunow 1884" /NCGR_SAMPLE_ID=MMETSP0160_2 /ASSEMBLY_ACC=CAM_ASM_000250 /LENGTH=324 /DNA_ID=CAMNT_0025463259 /DNA_START=102 /DNA_END=1073 /DNA_ORIENTATION=-
MSAACLAEALGDYGGVVGRDIGVRANRRFDEGIALELDVRTDLTEAMSLPPHAAKMLSAGLAASTSTALFNPLDTLRVRWQVSPRSDPTASGGVLRYGMNIVRTEGLIEGLWRPGLTANMLGMSLSAAVRFGYYETVRDGLVKLTSPTAACSGDGCTKNGAHMMVAGALCGAVGYAWTTPFHLLKTVIQAEKGLISPNSIHLTGAQPGKRVHVDSLFTGMLTLARDNGVSSLYRGTLPLMMRGSLFTAGQMMGYDGVKTFAISHGSGDGLQLHVVASIAASFGASFLSAPADLLMARYMTSNDTASILHCIKEIYAEGGVSSFW